MTTQTEIRDSFWEAHPQYEPERDSHKSQNDYRTDIRCAFVDYVDHLARNEEITPDLAERVTL